jgi:phosphoribosylglycinamide formyltransferase-1
MSRKEYDELVGNEIEKYEPDLIVLAGFMRIFTPAFVNRFKNKIINIHPALLPSFGGEGYYGERVHKSVLENGCEVSGCTVHFVDEQIDHGPIIIQKTVPVLIDDTHETLAKRVLEKEHEAMVEAVKLFCDERLKINGRKVEILE